MINPYSLQGRHIRASHIQRLFGKTLPDRKMSEFVLPNTEETQGTLYKEKLCRKRKSQICNTA